MKTGKALAMSETLAILNEKEPKPYFTVQEVADMLKKSYPTIVRRIKALEIDLYTKGTNTRTKYVKFADIDRIRNLDEEYHLLH